MLVLAGGGLLGVGGLWVFGSLTGRLAAMLAAVFKPSDLVGVDDGHTSFAISQATAGTTQIGAGQVTTSGIPILPPGADPTLGGILPAPVLPPGIPSRVIGGTPATRDPRQ